MSNKQFKYVSSKTYGPETGLSCCFRQWRADSHCSKLHGYALSFKFTFGTNTLDSKGWVVDFGGLKGLRDSLVHLFDHTLVVANDDPELEEFIELRRSGLVDLRILENVGCEAFAELAFSLAANIVKEKFPHATVISCEVREHGANSAIYFGGEQ